MQATDKIKSFSSVGQLLEEIRKDTQATDVLARRYAVRFILLDNFKLYQDFVTEMSRLGMQNFHLEHLLDSENQDSWITNDTLINEVRQLSGQVVVSPFSEIIRFYRDDKFKALLGGMTQMEFGNQATRIYIPLIGLRHRFENFLKTFSRIEESQPVWAVHCEKSQPVEITMIPTDFPCPQSIKCLRNVYDWLVFWKTHAPTERILCSSDPLNTYAEYAQPDNIFDIRKIDTAYDFITKFLNVSIGIEYEEQEEKYWLQFLPNIQEGAFSFRSFANKHFNVQTLTIKDVLNKWTSPESSEFDRWLLKHYYLEHLADENHPYLTKIMTSCTDYSPLRLFCKTALSIFEDTGLQSRAEERNELLRLFAPQYELPASDLQEIEKQIKTIAKSDTKKAFALCSGRFAFEKILFIGWYKEGKLSMEALQKVYPDFVAYMQDARLDGWYNDYIQAYKKAKVENNYTEEIAAWIKDKNANEASFYEWYNTDLKSSEEWLAKESADKVYWVDGLGIEYLSLIKEIIASSNFEIEKLEIAKTGIPSSTEHNRFEKVTEIKKLDEYIHGNRYSYPQTICEEIELVKSIFNEILNQSNKTTIAIVSDHGLTALSRLVESRKYETKASHEGRYIQVDSNETLGDPDYVRCKNGADCFKVALTHASLNKKPTHEAHGGCTPEEILVPFLVISNKHKAGATPKNTKAEVDESPKTALEIPVEFEENELF